MKNQSFKICSRGHKYNHSSDCPVCPICWPNFYKENSSGDFDMLAAPAQRALHNANIKFLEQLAEWKEEDLLKLHGMGPNAMSKIKVEMKKKNLSFKKKSEI